MFKRIPMDRQTILRFIKFFIVGGTCYLVGVATFNLFKWLMAPNYAFSGSFLVSMATHYTLNRFWALKSHRTDNLRQLIEYLLTAAASYGISFSTFKILNLVYGFNLLWSQALSQPPATLVTFLVLNFWVFKHRPSENEKA